MMLTFSMDALFVRGMRKIATLARCDAVKWGHPLHTHAAKEFQVQFPCGLAFSRGLQTAMTDTSFRLFSGYRLRLGPSGGHGLAAGPYFWREANCLEDTNETGNADFSVNATDNCHRDPNLFGHSVVRNGANYAIIGCPEGAFCFFLLFWQRRLFTRRNFLYKNRNVLIVQRT